MVTPLSFKQRAEYLDSQYEDHSDLFEIPTFESMGLRDRLEGKSGESGESGDTGSGSNHSPPHKVTYLCGNSLGLMPKSTPLLVNKELKAWGDRGVESHFRHPLENQGCVNWVDIDLPVVPLLAPIVGARQNEVACMGTLTMNLNSLLCSFYQPTETRYKILFEKHAFPSDYYAMLNQVRLHGLDEEDAIIQMAPRKGEFLLRTEDILSTIEKEGESIAVVCFSGIQYYTGQYFDMERITRAGHEKGCIVGWDLAHAVGNVEVKLHEWDVDFAAWCSYKYLNAGPGGIGGIFINSRFFEDSNWRPRLAGWWGNNSSIRFEMREEFEPIRGALGFRQSNPSVLDVVSLRSALETYEKCGGIKKLREKSKEMTGFLQELLVASEYYREKEEEGEPHFTIITPLKADERGAQISLLFGPGDVMERVFKYMNERGVICDDRKPNVIRLAPVASYNGFRDCYEGVRVMEEGLRVVSGGRESTNLQ
ncbi:DEKNAAC104416 [Brettanomyces naardenensis]|uniref:Kynureninase n=1 Tax=Brettanomyces naardenensis TaxID=13370 RepID=A0A448YQS9_BRENA|nr:DEKNAAC104416 [Brettanomyces naardenensis]